MDSLTNEETVEGYAEYGDLDYGELIEQHHLLVVKNLDLNRQSIFRYFLVVNLFHATGLFLYPLKTESFWFSDVFKGYRKSRLA